MLQEEIKNTFKHIKTLKKETTLISSDFSTQIFLKVPFCRIVTTRARAWCECKRKKVKNKIAEKEIWETETNINVKWGKSLFSPRRKKNKWNQRNLYREKILNKREKKLTNTNLKPETYKSTAKTTTTTTTVTYKQIKMLYFREINVNANSCRLGSPSPIKLGTEATKESTVRVLNRKRGTGPNFRRRNWTVH